MNWPDLSMGGYGFYVWGSYLVFADRDRLGSRELETTQESAYATTTAII